LRRVLAIIPDLRNPDNKGGIQVFNGYLLEAMRNLGCELRVIGVNDRPRDARAKTPLGDIDLKPCRIGPGRANKAVAGLRLAKELVTYKPDLVLNGHLLFSRLCAKACAATRTPFVTVTHGIELWNPRPDNVEAMARSELVLGVSRHTCARLRELMPGLPDDRIRVFPNTFDHERFAPRPRNEELARKLGVEEGDRVALTVCRIAKTEELKGYRRTLGCVREVSERIDRFRYVLAGKGDDLEGVRAFVREHGIDDVVRTPGFIADDELVDLFNLCDVFVMPSMKEGFGIVFLEAMACGKPVIGGNRDGSVDPLMDGEAGVLVDPTSDREITRALVDVLDANVDPSLIDPGALRARVVDAYGFDAFTERTRGVLEAVPSERAGASEAAS
jgi:glycosyltransferase involved in cell wall biosynthesis